MTFLLRNHQRRDPVPVRRLARCAERAARHLGLVEPGTLAVHFVDGRTIERLNRRYLHHAGLTDVLSFRYPRESIVGEVFVSPAVAKAYARKHRIPYQQELTRYMIHGLLHWMGFDDRTPPQQQLMRALEECLLSS